jgi:uncharacterized protein
VAGSLEIKHVPEAFIVERDGKRLAEMTYHVSNEGPTWIDHTEVSDELRGQGVGRKLLDALVAWARAENIKLVPSCSYARSVFDKDPTIRDVLAG